LQGVHPFPGSAEDGRKEARVADANSAFRILNFALSLAP